MGLDTVELVMEVENQFRIKIGDEHYGEILTVGNLMDYVVDRLAADGRLLPSDACPNLSAFCRLRRNLLRISPLARRDVRLKVPLERLVPKPDRQQAWARLADELGCTLPELVRPVWMSRLFRGVVLTGFGFLLLSKFHPQVPLALVLLIAVAWSVVALIAWFVLSAATEPAAVHIPQWITVEGLVLKLTESEAAARTDDTGSMWTVAEARQMVRRIFVEQLAVPLERLRRDARIIDDLGLD